MIRYLRNYTLTHIFIQLLSHSITQSAVAQSLPRPEIDLTAFVQNLLPLQPENANSNDLYESLLQLYTSPLDLNTCTRDELEGIYLLSERQLNSFFGYRYQFGNLLSVYELQAVPDFDLPTIYKLMAFATVVPENRKLWNSLSNPTQNYFIFRTENVLEQKKGFTPATPDSKGVLPQRFLGSPTQWYARYRYSRSRDFSFGFTMEKDEGEKFNLDPKTRNYGPDFLSFHAQVQNRGRLKNLILGDYQLQIGQGLVFSAGFVLGKGQETVYTTRRPTTGARPYTSVVEGGFFRGITATFALSKRLELTAMYSRIRRDGTVNDDNTTDTNDDFVSSILSSGLHRTPNEASKKAQVLENSIGAHLLYKIARGQFGATILNTTFDRNLQKKPTYYNTYDFAGSNNLIVGLHGNYLFKNYNIFGEAAHSQSGGVGVVAGALTSVSKRLDGSVLFRHFAPSFQSFFANSFGENSRNTNETGLYLGAKYLVYKKMTVGGYIDLYRFPFYKYLVNKQPTNGFDYLLQGTFTPNKRLTFYAIFREEHKEKDLPSRLSKKKETVGTTRRNLVLNVEYNAPKVWSFRTRLQGGTFNYDGFGASKGFLLLQDVNADWGKFSVNGRLALFNTDDYDSRQYAVERDVLYAVTLPAYYDFGYRSYVLVQYSPTAKIDLWLRAAQTAQPNKDALSSYVDEIKGSTRTEIKAQIRYKF
jgi:hypothetical protein